MSWPFEKREHLEGRGSRVPALEAAEPPTHTSSMVAKRTNQGRHYAQLFVHDRYANTRTVDLREIAGSV